MKKDDYVKIVAVDGNYRYGYIDKITDKGFTIVISLFDEGESKIAFDAAHNALTGQEPVNYVSNLSDIEKRIIPMLSIGYNTKQIASELSISPSTARTHLQLLRIKLHLDDRAQLIALSPALESRIKKQKQGNKAIET